MYEKLDLSSNRIELLFETLKKTNVIYWKQANETARAYPQEFALLAEPMLTWADGVLGERWREVLVRGYIAFVTEVNKAQSEYEQKGHYRHSSFAEVEKDTYGSAEFMEWYHWGVFATTFLWKHHLRLYQFFLQHFIPKLEAIPAGKLIDFGTGSGVWSALTLFHAKNWKTVGVDISPTSVAWATSLLSSAGMIDRAEVFEGNALDCKISSPGQAAISCFVLEHLETPKALLENMAKAILPGSPVFITGALTAAEVDHIYEFRRESELVALAESAGFRVVASLSAAPDRGWETKKFMPRSMALVLERRHGEWW